MTRDEFDIHLRQHKQQYDTDSQYSSMTSDSLDSNPRIGKLRTKSFESINEDLEETSNGMYNHTKKGLEATLVSKKKIPLKNKSYSLCDLEHTVKIKCELCDNSFQSQQLLERHMVDYHKVDCSKIGKISISSDDIRSNSRTYRCNVIGRDMVEAAQTQFHCSLPKIYQTNHCQRFNQSKLFVIFGCRI